MGYPRIDRRFRAIRTSGSCSPTDPDFPGKASSRAGEVARLFWSLAYRSESAGYIPRDLAGGIFLRCIYACRRQRVVVHPLSRVGSSSLGGTCRQHRCPGACPRRVLCHAPRGCCSLPASASGRSLPLGTGSGFARGYSIVPIGSGDGGQSQRRIPFLTGCDDRNDPPKPARKGLKQINMESKAKTGSTNGAAI